MGNYHPRLGMLSFLLFDTEADHQVTENGLTGSIMTFYEITDGDLSYTTGMSRYQGYSTEAGLMYRFPRDAAIHVA